MANITIETIPLIIAGGVNVPTRCTVRVMPRNVMKAATLRPAAMFSWMGMFFVSTTAAMAIVASGKYVYQILAVVHLPFIG